jgi:phosphopantetheinyl transferase
MHLRATLASLLDIVARRALPDDDAAVALWICPVLPPAPTFLSDATAHGWLDALDIAALSERRAPSAAHSFAVRRVFRRAVVAAHTGLHPTDIRFSIKCGWCGSTAHGRPTLDEPLEGLHLSASATGGLAAIAVSRREVGLDVERASRPEFECTWSPLQFAGPMRVLSKTVPSRSRPVDQWTAIEALTKAIGIGLTATGPEVSEALRSWHLTWSECGEEVVACLATDVQDPELFLLDLRRDVSVA